LTLVTPRTVPLVILHIGAGASIIMIKIALHALEIFTTPVGILVDTLVVEKSKPKLNPLFESIIEHVVGLVDELVVGVKKVDFDV
jgi:hypothetical protein